MPTSTPSSRVLFACGTYFLPSPNLVHPWLASKLFWRILLSIIPSLNNFTSLYWCLRVCIWVVSQSLYLGCFVHILPILYPSADISPMKIFLWLLYLFLIKFKKQDYTLKVIILSQNLAPFCWFIKSPPFPIFRLSFIFFITFCHNNFIIFHFCQNCPFSPKSSCLHLWSLWRWIVWSQPPKSNTRDLSTWGRRHK